MSINEQDLRKVASEVQREFSNTEARDVYINPTGPPASVALASVGQGRADPWLRSNHWRPGTRSRTLPQYPGQQVTVRQEEDPSSGIWFDVDHLQRALVLAGYLSIDDWRNLRRRGLLGVPDASTKEALELLLEDAQEAGVSAQDLLRNIGDTPTVSGASTAPGPDLRERIRSAYREQLGRAPTRAELARFERVWRSMESQGVQAAAVAELDGTTVEDTPSPEALVSERLEVTPEANAVRVREGIENFLNLVGGA